MSPGSRVRGRAAFGVMIAASILSMVGNASAQAQTAARTVDEFLAQSDLAFEGRVEKIEYVLSEPGDAEGAAIPHTFVTYRAERAFVGLLPGETVTLRFMGGLFPGTTTFLTTSQKPQFDLDDHDILFVRGNTESVCPLVGKLAGRLRIIGGHVYSEEGRAVRVAADGSLGYGATCRLPEVQTTVVEGRFLQTSKGGNKLLDPPGDAVVAAELETILVRAAAGAASKRNFVNADPSVPFRGPNPTPAPPPAR